MGGANLFQIIYTSSFPLCLPISIIYLSCFPFVLSDDNFLLESCSLLHIFSVNAVIFSLLIFFVLVSAWLDFLILN
jgi:hypothetical protein